ncbi:MAG: DUF4476 domain-containing protein, partial [Ferruginibacter sp.]
IKEAEKITTGDEFARILAEVVNDPSINQVIVEKKVVEVPVNIPVAKEEIKAIPVNLKSNDETITKIQAELPVVKKADVVNNDAKVIDTGLQNPDLRSGSVTVKNEDVVITEKKTVSGNTPESLAATGLNGGKVTLNRDCKRSATQVDFLKLRKIMAAEANEKAMTKAANKQFISTCYTTEQVKILGALFITEEGKYKFFVAAFPHVWDIGNFSALEDQLNDEYYRTRFKAMLSH